MRNQQQIVQLTIADEQPRYLDNEQKKRVRHIYLEQQNIYGRFIPYLLLRDQLQSQVDSSGSTALHHMCSYNSPYLPLYLSSIQQGDPILNKKSKLGHTPLDVAGLYCSKKHIQMLKQKGAIDNGNVDFWAIQGANPSNWSGKVYPQKKPLIHWAAYNDMPEVILQYSKQGVSLSQADSNGLTPMDLAVLNKSYNSIRVLSELGQRPKQQLIRKTDSKSVKQHFKRLDETKQMIRLKAVIKISSIILYLVLCMILSSSQFNLALVAVNLFVILHLLVKKHSTENFMNNNRTTQFTSQLFLGKKINKGNHLVYLIIHILVVTIGLNSLINCKITNHFIGLIALIVTGFILAFGLHLFAQLYGIMKNLTYNQLFNSDKWPHLWSKIRYIKQRKILIRQFINHQDKGAVQNFKDYFSSLN